MTIAPQLPLDDEKGDGFQLEAKTVPKRLLEIGDCMVRWHAKHGQVRAVITLSSDLSDFEPLLKARYVTHRIEIDKRIRGPYVYVGVKE